MPKKTKNRNKQEVNNAIPLSPENLNWDFPLFTNPTKSHINSPEQIAKLIKNLKNENKGKDIEEIPLLTGQQDYYSYYQDEIPKNTYSPAGIDVIGDNDDYNSLENYENFPELGQNYRYFRNGNPMVKLFTKNGKLYHNKFLYNKGKEKDIAVTPEMLYTVYKKPVNLPAQVDKEIFRRVNPNNSLRSPLNNDLPYGMSEKNPYVPEQSDEIMDKIEKIQEEELYENQYKNLSSNLSNPEFTEALDIIPQEAIRRTSSTIHNNVLNRLNEENINPNNKQKVNKIIQEEAKKVNDNQFVYKDDIEAWKDRWESLKGMGQYLLNTINKYKKYGTYGIAGAAGIYALYKLIQYLRNRPKAEPAPTPVLPPAPDNPKTNNIHSPLRMRQRTLKRRRNR